MGVDRETKITNLFISVSKNKELLNDLEKQNIDSVGKEEHNLKPQLLITDDCGTVNTEEYYFDNDDNTIHYSGVLNTRKGEIYVAFTIPLSDIVLIDILQMSIKKLNKLKTAMEMLK